MGDIENNRVIEFRKFFGIGEQPTGYTTTDHNNQIRVYFEKDPVPEQLVDVNTGKLLTSNMMGPDSLPLDSAYEYVFSGLTVEQESAILTHLGKPPLIEYMNEPEEVVGEEHDHVGALADDGPPELEPLEKAPSIELTDAERTRGVESGAQIKRD